MDDNLFAKEDLHVDCIIEGVFFTNQDGHIGLWESNTPLTLYDASTLLMQIHAPNMAFNLDMGAYNFCQHYEDGTASSCGHPSAGINALTNFLVIETGGMDDQ